MINYERELSPETKTEDGEVGGEWRRTWHAFLYVRPLPVGRGRWQGPLSSNDESKGARDGRLSRTPGACACAAHTPTVIFIGPQETKHPECSPCLAKRGRPRAQTTRRSEQFGINTLRTDGIKLALDRPFLLVDRRPGRTSVAWPTQHCGPLGFGGHHQDRAWGDNQ